MPELIFLPDRDGTDRPSKGAGLVRMEGTAREAITSLTSRLLLPPAPGQTEEEAAAAWRGALAAALLLCLWDGVETTLRVWTLDENASPFAAMVMAARPARERSDPLQLLILEKGECRKTLGLVSRRKGLRLAADLADLSELLPERVCWYDRKTKRFLDPTPLLSEQDAELVVRRLHLMRLPDPEVNAFVADLIREQGRESRSVAKYEAEALDRLYQRVRVVTGKETFSALSVQEERYTLPEREPLPACFLGDRPVGGGTPEVQHVYLWKGVPFARTSATLGLRGTNHPQEDKALEAIVSELALLDEHSRRWQKDAVERIRAWLHEEEGKRTFSQAAAEGLRNRLEQLEEASREPQGIVALTWPWPEDSDAVRFLLRENLGDALAFAGSPFPDVLTKLEGAVDALGDTALRMSCRVGADAYLAPLSPQLAACLSSAPEGQGFVPEQLYLLPEEDGGMTASYLLRGQGELALTRRYASEEIVTLTAEETPTVAVWPCVPFRDGGWKAYFTYLHGEGLTLRVFSEGEWISATTGENGWAVAESTAYPSCVLIERNGLCLGALPNALPFLSVEPAGPAVAALDLGASCVTAMLHLGETTEPVGGSCMVRTLLDGGAAPLAEEFIAPRAETAAMPLCAVLTGEGSKPVLDGRRYVPESIEEAINCRQPLYSVSLSWRGDETSARARELLMHQIMLEVALEARRRGATSLTWRLAMPEAGGKAVWQRWMDPVIVLADVVAQESGLPLTLNAPAVSWTLAYQALGACLRDSVAHGSFAAVDLGGGGTSAHLWLRAMNRAAAGFSLQSGMQALLLGAVAEHSEQLEQDFSDCAEESLRQDLAAVAGEIKHAGASLRQMDRAVLLIELLLDMHAPAMAAHMNARYVQGRMTWLQALLLEHFALAMFLTGLMIEDASEQATLSHLLPEQLTLCFSGRGNELLLSMPAAAEGDRFLRAGLRADHPLRSILRYQSARSKLDVCQGLCRMPALEEQLDAEPDTPPLKTKESFAALIMRFLTLLRAVWPQACGWLHPTLFTAQGFLSPEGEDTVRHVAAQRYGDDLPTALEAALRDLRVAPETLNV